MHRQSICDHRYPSCCIHKHLHASIFTFICSHDLVFIHVLNCIYIFIYIHPYSSLSNYDHSHIHLHPCIQLCLSTLSIFIFRWLSSTSSMCIHNSSTFNYIHLRSSTSTFVSTTNSRAVCTTYMIYKHVLYIACSWMCIQAAFLFFIPGSMLGCMVRNCVRWALETAPNPTRYQGGS
jgi:hypothetical protein